MSTSVSQTFAVPASVSAFVVALPAECVVEEMDVPPGAPAECVELDIKRSGPGRSPGAAPPCTNAADAPAGLGLSGIVLLSRGPGDLPYSMCCQAYRKVSTNPMFGCAVLGVRCFADLFLRRFQDSVSAERLGSRTRTGIVSKPNSNREDGDDVPRPKTARPEGGCLTIHRQCHYLVLYWLKRPLRDES